MWQLIDFTTENYQVWFLIKEAEANLIPQKDTAVHIEIYMSNLCNKKKFVLICFTPVEVIKEPCDLVRLINLMKITGYNQTKQKTHSTNKLLASFLNLFIGLSLHDNKTWIESF